MGKPILGIYTRVSSKQQEDDGTSIDYQIKIGKKMSKRLGMKFELYNDGGISSWSDNINIRPELVRLLKDIQSTRVKNIWGWNMDRVGRNSESWWTILKVLTGWKVNLYIGESNKPYDFNSPQDRLIVGILSLLTTYDNELRRMRMMFGKMESLKRGQTFIGGTIPFGYTIDEKKNLIKHPKESEMVKKMFEMYGDGNNTTDIQMMLDGSEFKPRRSKSGWSLGSVQKILGNEIYIGKQQWEWSEKTPDKKKVLIEKIDIKTPRIVSNDLFSKTSTLRKRRSGHNQYDTDYHSLLKGFLFCPHCGYQMNHRMKTSEVNDYYYCVYMERVWLKRDKSDFKPYERTGDSCDMKKSLIMEQTDELVWNKFLQIFSESKWVKEEFKKRGLSPKGKLDDEIKQKVKTNINKVSLLKRKETNLNDQIVKVELRRMNGEITKPIYEGLLNNLDETMKSVLTEMNNLQDENDNLKRSSSWIDWVSQMNKEIERMKDWSFEDKREKIEQFIKRIDVSYNEVTQQHDLNFIFSVPLVGDKLVYKDIKNKSKGYKIQKGEHNIVITHKNTKKMNSEKVSLMNVISKLREDDMSYGDISDHLNKNGLKTIRGGKWSRQSVRRFFDYGSKDLTLVEIENDKIQKKK